MRRLLTLACALALACPGMLAWPDGPPLVCGPTVDSRIDYYDIDCFPVR